MTLDEALQALHCPKNTDWAAVQRQYDERYNELQRLRETATTREEQDAYAVRLQAVEKAYMFLKGLPGFGPVTAPEPTLPPELRQALGSPYADIRVGAICTLGHLLQADVDLASLARQTLESLEQDGSPEVAQAARQALQEPRQAADARQQPQQGSRPAWDHRHWRVLLLTLCGVAVLGGLWLIVQQQAEQTPKTWSNSIGMEFVLIPAGTFQMGSTDRDAYDDEKPVHQVTISRAFYLGKYEVTQAQWQAVMGSNPSNFKGDPNLPVENVSWDAVQAFIRKLNDREGGTRYRLPSEAQWEYAARAGSMTAYSFGDNASQLGDYAWYHDNAEGKTHPVGQKRPNAWGLYDMHGNVWEWVQDWYGVYAAAAVSHPTGPVSGWYRIGRSGGWDLSARGCRSAYRHSLAPVFGYSYLGFRLLRTVP
jgi:formylglycine-generating enzyme required for sulfatase activity